MCLPMDPYLWRLKRLAIATMLMKSPLAGVMMFSPFDGNHTYPETAAAVLLLFGTEKLTVFKVYEACFNKQMVGSTINNSLQARRGFYPLLGRNITNNSVHPPESSDQTLARLLGAVGPLLHGKGPIIAKPNKGGSPTKDLLVTHLSHPRSGPAPPASPEVIRSLERRTVDRDLLRMNGIMDCSICTDEMQLRQSVTVLRCKHWLHERCIISWLKEHSTCPICRNPIERN